MKIKKMVLCTTIVLVTSIMSGAHAFSDFDENHWAYNNVMEMQKKGIVSGYNDGTFKPDMFLTREQFITMLANALESKFKKKEDNFKDIDNRWSTEYIKAVGYCLVDEGEILFNPEGQAIREDIAMGIVKSKGLENSKYDINILNNFSDFNSISINRRKYVAIAVENGFMNGNANGTFSPKRALTRAEGATVIKNLLTQNDYTIKWMENQYEDAGSFSEGLVRVKRNDSYGFVNAEGVEIIPCIYENVEDFSNGVAIVSKNARYGLIDKTGSELLNCGYDICDEQSTAAIVFWNGETSEIAIVNKKNNKINKYDNINYISGYFDDDWDDEEEAKDKLLIQKKDNKYYYINLATGKLIDCGEFGEFADGIGSIKKNNMVGFIDIDGNELIPCIYDDAGYFSEGLVAVCKNGKWGYINSKGEEIIPFVYEKASDFSEGFAAVRKNNKWGYIDNTGNEIIALSYDWVGQKFSGELGYVVKEGNRSMIDITGNEIISDFENCWRVAYNDWVCIQKYGKIGVINKEGKEILPFEYDDIDFLYILKYPVVELKKDGESIYAYLSNEIHFYDDVLNLSEGFLGIEQNNKWGVINDEGKEVTACMYSWIGTFSDGMAAVCNADGLWGYINLNGEEIIPCKYDFGTSNFSNGIACVIDSNGDNYIPNFRIGYINKNGAEIIPCEYDFVHAIHRIPGIWSVDFSENKIVVVKDGKWGIIELH